MTDSALRAALLLAGAGSVIVLVNLFGLVGLLAGFAAMAGGLVASREARSRRGLAEVDWWRLLGAGTALVAVGVPLAELLETPGGLLTGIGGALGVIAVALALP